jgi:ABC-type transport system substrate-binding protein
LILAAVLVIGLALFLMYVTPPEGQDSGPLSSSKSVEPPKEIKDHADTQPEPGKIEVKTEASKEIPPSIEFSQKIEIAKIETFPANKLLALGGRLALRVYVKNPTTSELTGQTVALLLDGGPYARKSVDLPPGSALSVYFAIENFESAGSHEVQVNQEKFTISVLDISNVVRLEKSQIPSDPKFIGAAQGLSALGLPGGTLILPISGGPRTLNPVVATNDETIEVTRLTNGFLIELNPLTGEPEPGLASSWEFSSDHKELKLYLRKGVKFSDDKELTADDVLFTFNDVLFNPDIRARERTALETDGSYPIIEKLDTYAVRLVLTQPFRPLLHALAGVAILPRHQLAEKIARLNPGAHGYWLGAKSVIEQSHDGINEKAPEPLKQLDQALAAMETPIAKTDLSELEKQARLATELMETLMDTLKGSTLQMVVGRAKDYLAQALDQAQRDQYKGVSPQLFDQIWSIQEAREHPERIVGLGPFIFKSYDPQRRVVLERNLAYWKLDEKGLQLPYLDRLVLTVTPSANTALARFQNGEIDMLEPRARDWAALQSEAASKRWQLLPEKIEQEPERTPIALRDEFLAFNFDAQDETLKKIFRDVRFRQAISHATDRRRLIQEVYAGLALPVNSDDPEFSLDKAKSLFEAMGLKDTNTDGFRERHDGKPIKISLLVNKENEERAQIAEIYAETLKTLGIQVTVQSTEFDQWVQAVLSGQFEAALVGLSRSSDVYFTTNFRKSDGPLHFWHRSAQAEPLEWEVQMDHVLEQARLTEDDTVPEELYRKIRAIETENQPVVFTVIPYYLVVFHRSIANAENIRPTGKIWGMTDMLWWRDDNRRFGQ